MAFSPAAMVVLSALVSLAVGTEIVCYWGAWSSYRSGAGKVSVTDLDPSKCTIYIYAFAVLNANTLLMQSFDHYLDITQKGYEKFVGMKQTNPDLKVLVALGGYTDSQSSKYSTMLASPTHRSNFIREALVFVQQHGFDGLDLDYEYPSAQDKTNFAVFVEELVASFRPQGLLVTAAVSAAKWRVDQGYDVSRLSTSLDLINLMTYDFHGSWENVRADHHSPLYSRSSDSGSGFDSDSAVKLWKSKGAPASKLALGIPVYGRTWRVTAANKTPPVSANGAGSPGQFTAEPGILSYLEICMAIQNNGWTKEQDANGIIGPYAYSSSGEWVGYDDIEMVEKKTEYAIDEGLGGVMIWDSGSSDVRNVCGDGAWPILSAMKRVIDGDITTTQPPTTSTTAPPASSTTQAPSTSTVPPASSTTEPAVTSTTPPASSTTHPSTAQTTTAPGHFVCPEPYGLFSDPADCHRFYHCYHGLYVHYTCPTGTGFDPALQVCNWLWALEGCD